MDEGHHDLPNRKPREDVEALLRRAGVGKTAPQMAGSLRGESVLLICGTWQETLLIYGSGGREIGAAVRLKDRRSKVGYSSHCELRDSELVWIVRDMTPRGVLRTHRFAVLDADEAEIATITQSGSGTDRYEIAVGGPPSATIQENKLATLTLRRPSTGRPSSASTRLLGRAQALYDRLAGKVWTIDASSGDPLARVTYVPGSTTSRLDRRRIRA